MTSHRILIACRDEDTRRSPREVRNATKTLQEQTAFIESMRCGSLRLTATSRHNTERKPR